MPPPDFSTIVTGLMTERDLSLRGLARQIPINQGQLSRVLNRVRPPSAELARRCDEIFGTGSRLAQAAEQVRASVAISRTTNRSAGQRVAQAHPTPPTGQGANPSQGWGQPGALERTLLRREVSGEAICAFDDMVTLLRRLDDEVGPGQLIDTVAAHLAAVTTLLSQAAPAGDAFLGLSRVASGLSQLMGWLSFELNDPGRAERHLIAAHRAAVAAGDGALAAYALSWQGLVVGQVDPRAGLTLALTARRRAGADAAASVVAWLSRVEAESSAGQGNRYETEQALERLTRAAAQPRTERDPAWTYFIDDSQIAAYRGVCYVRLAQGRDAEHALRQALDALPPSFVRDRCLYLTYLSAAHLLQQQPEAAAVAATEAFLLAERTQSPRSIDRLTTISRGLAPWQNLPEVEELGDLLTTHRYG
jgi:tetratricopeptide (TPR) repeat protein/plasmid maintenance system antidote protein VapI